MSGLISRWRQRRHARRWRGRHSGALDRRHPARFYCVCGFTGSTRPTQLEAVHDLINHVRERP